MAVSDAQEAMRPSALLLPLAVAGLILPWLWPLASGPWPAAQQAIWSLGCAGLLLILRVPGWPRRASLIAAAWLLAATVSAVIGLVQYFGWSSALSPWVNITPLGEAFGNLRQRNQFASLMALGAIALLWGLAPGRQAGAGAAAPFAQAGDMMSRPALRILLLVLLATAMAASRSRTGMLQLLLIVCLAWVWRCEPARQALRSALVLVVAYVVAAVLLPMAVGGSPVEHGIAGRLRPDSMTCGSRLTLWANVWHLIAQRPWSGWGWGELDFAHFMAVYPGERFCEILDNAHNLPLHLAVELGLPAAIAICAAGVAWLWRARPWAESDPGRRMAWLALGSILLHSMLEYPLWYGPFLMGLVCALILLSRHPDDAPAGSPTHGMAHNRERLAMIIRTAGVAMVLAAIYAAWDYHRVSQIYTAPERRSPYYRSQTMDKIRDSWLFSNQVRFAELVTTDVSQANAAAMYRLSKDLLHFSPEARVAEKLVESAAWIGDDALARTVLARYRTAFPKESSLWFARRQLEDEPPEALGRLLRR